VEQGRVLVQVLAPTLFNMPSTLDKVGQLVNFPHPTMQLPWEKLVCWVLELLSFVWQDTERFGVMLFLGDLFSDYYFWLAAAAALWKAELSFCVVLMMHHLSDAVT
jgi:hypothetical protein